MINFLIFRHSSFIYCFNQQKSNILLQFFPKFLQSAHAHVGWRPATKREQLYSVAQSLERILYLERRQLVNSLATLQHD